MEKLLQKGQRFEFSDFYMSRELMLTISWDLSEPINQSFAAFFLENKGQIRDPADLVSFKRQAHPSGAMAFTETLGSEHVLSFNLNKIPTHVARISLVIYQKKAYIKNRGLNEASRVQIRFLDPQSGEVLASFTAEEGLQGMNVLVIGEIYKYFHSWRFNAIGNGFVYSIDTLLRNYLVGNTLEINDFLPTLNAGHATDVSDLEPPTSDEIHDTLSKEPNEELAFSLPNVIDNPQIHASEAPNINMRPVRTISEWETIICRAAMASQELTVRDALNKGADPNAQITVFKDGVLQDISALIAGIHVCHVGIVKLLLENGANSNEKSSSGICPLILATQNRNINIMKSLLEHGADPNLRGSSIGGNAITRALAVYNSDTSYPIIQVIGLLMMHGADINALVGEAINVSILHAVAYMEWTDVLEVMLAPGNPIPASIENLMSLSSACQDLGLMSVLDILDNMSKRQPALTDINARERNEGEPELHIGTLNSNYSRNIDYDDKQDEVDRKPNQRNDDSEED